MDNRKRIAVFAALVSFLILAVMIATLPQMPAEAAPMAAPTPITQSPREENPRMANFWGSTTALTADTRSTCFDVAGYNIMDLQWVIDQGTTNTTTLKLQFTNDQVTYVDGINVVANNAADANGMNQYNVFGRWACVYADLTNSNTLTVTAIGVMK